MEEIVQFKILPTDELVDDIAIYTLPEERDNGKVKGWQSVTKVDIRWKGHLVIRKTFPNVEKAIMHLPAIFDELRSAPIEDRIPESFGIQCMQPGCSEPGIHLYKIENSGSQDESEPSKARIFCELHKDRGNVYTDDCNEVYILIDDEDPKVIPLLKKSLPPLEKLAPEDKTEESSEESDKGKEND